MDLGEVGGQIVVAVAVRLQGGQAEAGNRMENTVKRISKNVIESTAIQTETKTYSRDGLERKKAMLESKKEALLRRILVNQEEIDKTKAMLAELDKPYNGS